MYHDTAGIGIGGPNVVVDHPRIFNVGDGIRIRDNADNFRVEDAYLSYIRDDCIENDRLFNGTITDSFLDGCYVAFSTRKSSGDPQDGRLNTVTISNSLVRLQAMPTVYSGSAAGHGGFFKWDDPGGTSPKLNITNTHLPRRPEHQSPGSQPARRVRRHVLGEHDGVARRRCVPGNLPPCFTLTTDRSVWDAAARRGTPRIRVWSPVPRCRSATRRSTRAPPARARCGSRSRCPRRRAPARPCTVYWSTAQGTAGSSDYAFKKGKTVFNAADVLKTVTVAVTPDTKDESNELMYLVAAGVDGGENHRERGTGTILDDDPGSGVRLLTSDATVVEGDSGVRNIIVPITLTESATADVAVALRRPSRAPRVSRPTTAPARARSRSSRASAR